MFARINLDEINVVAFKSKANNARKRKWPPFFTEATKSLTKYEMK